MSLCRLMHNSAKDSASRSTPLSGSSIGILESTPHEASRSPSSAAFSQTATALSQQLDSTPTSSQHTHHHNPTHCQPNSRRVRGPVIPKTCLHGACQIRASPAAGTGCSSKRALCLKEDRSWQQPFSAEVDRHRHVTFLCGKETMR